MLNGSYGYDAMNTENYGHTSIYDRQMARCKMMSNKFRNMRQLGDDSYQVILQNIEYKCDTCIHEAFFYIR